MRRLPAIPAADDVIILSCANKIGDSVIYLAVAGWLRAHRPKARIVAIINRFTAGVWRRSAHVDEVIELESLDALGETGAAKALQDLGASTIVHIHPNRSIARWARTAKIGLRIGTGRRWWMWLYCNRLMNFSRKRGGLHEAQLCIRLLEPLGVPMPDDPQVLSAHYGVRPPAVSDKVAALLTPKRRNIVIHPMADSGPEWGLANFAALISLLDPERYNLLITGIASEAAQYREVLPLDGPNITDLGGLLSVDELIQLIAGSDGLVASSTGPLHLAAALGVTAIGLFTMMWSRSPKRWAPIGVRAKALVLDPACPVCAKDAHCDCVRRIPAARVVTLLDGEAAGANETG